MTRVAYLDPVGGVAGDMLLAALLDAGAPREILDDVVHALGLTGVDAVVSRVERAGLVATHIHVRTPTRTHERPAHELREIVATSALDPVVRARSLAALDRLVVAEAAIHGVAMVDVVLHELGGDDTLVDICGVFALLHALGIDRLSCAPLPMGTGVIESAHGPLPLPAPATFALLRGVPVVGVDVAAELVTPTGAAIVVEATELFGPLPTMTVDAIGVGAGTRDVPGRPNILRLFVGQSADADPGGTGEVVVLEANVDDLLPELVPDVIDACLAAGALDAWAQPIQMKKGRPGLLLGVLARPADERVLAHTLLRHSTTLGVRVRRSARLELDRAIREVQIDGHPVRIKIGLLDGSVVNLAPEHDDCAAVAAATGRPVKQIWAEALVAATAVGATVGDADGLTR